MAVLISAGLLLFWITLAGLTVHHFRSPMPDGVSLNSRGFLTDGRNSCAHFLQGLLAAWLWMSLPPISLWIDAETHGFLLSALCVYPVYGYGKGQVSAEHHLKSLGITMSSKHHRLRTTRYFDGVSEYLAGLLVGSVLSGVQLAVLWSQGQVSVLSDGNNGTCSSP
mmetsp:Transcript_66575/g.159115  ORF Transcript_66575/g.159115 Transcript_66575/m.159115 type:complete len:166 (-) Transcript_66575:76-573(-)